MKKLIGLIILVLVVSLFFVPVAIAEDTKSDTPEVEPFEMQRFNLQGDTLYLIQQQSLAIGVGCDIAKLYDIVKLRVEAAGSVQSDLLTNTLIGVGVGVELPSLIEKFGGEWTLKGVIPSVGILGLVNLRETITFEPALYLSIVKVEF